MPQVVRVRPVKPTVAVSRIIPTRFGEGAIDIGGIDFGNTKKWRDMRQNPHFALLVDDASPAGPHAVEIRGAAEPHFIGGELINPPFPNFQPEFVRVRPHRIVSWEWKPRASRRVAET